MPFALTLGAVAYDPRVVTIWDGLARWLERRNLRLDCVFYQTYEQQVAALLAGHIDVAWNSSLAWLDTQRLAQERGLGVRTIAMRDADRDLQSVIVTLPEGPVQSIADLNGKRVGVGAPDSPQSTLMPLYCLLEAGVTPVPVCFDLQAGRHGDALDGERAAVQALAEGQVDAACVLDANLLLFALEGLLPGGTPRVVAETERYDCRCLTALSIAPADSVDLLEHLLLEMDYNDPDLRPIFDLEGLRAWRPGRSSGFEAVGRALQALRDSNWL